jgi:hypothetical protein
LTVLSAREFGQANLVSNLAKVKYKLGEWSGDHHESGSTIHSMPSSGCVLSSGKTLTKVAWIAGMIGRGETRFCLSLFFYGAFAAEPLIP